MAPRKKATLNTLLTEVNSEKTPADTTKTSDLEIIRSQISKEINGVIDLLISQINALNETRKQTQEVLTQQEKQRKQIEEEGNFDKLMEQKKKQAEFDEKLSKEQKEFESEKESEIIELKQKKEMLDQKEKEYNELKLQVETFPTKLEKAVEEIKKQVTVELKRESESEKKFMIQKADFDLKLLQQQVNNLQTLVKQQEKEILSSKDEKNQAIEKVKELAVAIIKGKENPLPSTPIE